MLHIPGRKKPLPLPKSLAASAPRPVAPSADSTLAVPQRATQKRVQGLFDKMNAIRRKKQPAAPPNSATPPRAAQSASPPRPLSTQQHSPNTNADSADFAPTQPRDVVGEETLVSNMEFGGGFDDTDEQSTVTPYDLASSVPPASTSETMVAATTGRQGRCSDASSSRACVPKPPAQPPTGEQLEPGGSGVQSTFGSKPLPSVSSPTLSASPSAFAPAAQPSTRRPPPPPPPPPAPLSPRRSTAMVAGQSLLAHSGQEVTHTAPLTDSSSSSTAGQAPQATTSNPSLTAEQVRDLAQRFQEQNRFLFEKAEETHEMVEERQRQASAPLQSLPPNLPWHFVPPPDPNKWATTCDLADGNLALQPNRNYIIIAIIIRFSKWIIVWIEDDFTRTIIIRILARAYAIAHSRAIALGHRPEDIVVCTYIQCQSAMDPVDEWEPMNDKIIPLEHQGLCYASTRHLFTHHLLVSPSALGTEWQSWIGPFYDRLSAKAKEKQAPIYLSESARLEILFQEKGSTQTKLWSRPIPTVNKVVEALEQQSIDKLDDEDDRFIAIEVQETRQNRRVMSKGTSEGLKAANAFQQTKTVGRNQSIMQGPGTTSLSYLNEFRKALKLRKKGGEKGGASEPKAVPGVSQKRRMPQDEEASPKSEQPFACHSCSKSFSTSYLLKRHCATRHDDKGFKCPSCGRTFELSHNLERHIRTVHGTEEDWRAFACGEPSCGKVFKESSALKRHIAHRHEDPRNLRHACTLAGCSKRFFARSDLIQHEKRFHPGTTGPWTCCTSTYTTTAKYLLHLQKKHPEQLPPEFRNPSSNKRQHTTRSNISGAEREDLYESSDVGDSDAGDSSDSSFTSDLSDEQGALGRRISTPSSTPRQATRSSTLRQAATENFDMPQAKRRRLPRIRDDDNSDQELALEQD